jgi:hypothetical protein
MAIPVILGTKSMGWSVPIKNITTANTIDLASATSTVGGNWDRKATTGNVVVNNLGPDANIAPNGIIIAPYIYGTSGATISGMNYKFRIDAYRGKDNNLDRICLCSGTTGTYRIHTFDDNSTPTVSARYTDTIALTQDYGYDIGLIDAAGDNGKGAIYFDLKGAYSLCFSLVSTISAGAKLGFSVTGW